VEGFCPKSVPRACGLTVGTFVGYPHVRAFSDGESRHGKPAIVVGKSRISAMTNPDGRSPDGLSATIEDLS